MNNPNGLRKRTVAALLGARATYRLAMYGSGIGLLAIWGDDQFAGYAAATGSMGWLFALTSSGPEKAALALVGRPGGVDLERLFVRMAVVPFAAMSLIYLAVVGAMSVSQWHPPSELPRYLAAAAVSVGVGCVAVLVALYRLHGRPVADWLSYSVLAAGYPLIVALAWAVGLTVNGVLAVLLGLTAVVNVALLSAWRPRQPAVRPIGSDRRRQALRASLTLGTGELLAMAAASVLYVVLATRATPVEISRFYVLSLMSAAFSVGWSYLLRLAQPRAVAWLEREGDARGWRLASRVSAATGLGGGLAAVALVVVLLGTREEGMSLPLVALAMEMALYAAATLGQLVVENIDAAGRRFSAGGAAIQFAVVVGLGWLLVPEAGAAGAFAALCAGEAAKATLLWRMSRRVIAGNGTVQIGEMA